ncbi:MAG: glycosyltransferase family 4 protein [Anaerohalosphaeraceae bacterium]
MKILTLNYEFPPVGGGAAPVSLQLAKQFAAMGHTVDVVTMRWQNLPHQETIDGVTVYRTPALRKRPDFCRTHEMASYLLGAAGKAYRLSRTHHYDIVHAHFIIPTGPLACMLKSLCGIPVVITCHGSDVPGYNPDRFKRGHRLLRPIWRSLVHRADRLVCPSYSLEQLLLKHCPDARTRVIPNGIDPASFVSGQEGEKKKQILLCSRLLPRKGFQHLIEAVRDTSLDWQVHIIGDGPYRQELETQAKGSKTPIVFHGWLDRQDPRFIDLFRQSAVFVFPSEAENFPTVLLEAMAAGLAVITSDAGGCPEVVGEAGITVPAGNVAALRSAVLSLLGDANKRKTLSAAAIRRVDEFTWPGVAKRYLELFESIA